MVIFDFVKKYWFHLTNTVIVVAAVSGLLARMDKVAKSLEGVTSLTVYASVGGFILLGTSVSLCYELTTRESGEAGERQRGDQLPASELIPDDIEFLPNRQSNALHRISNRLYRPDEKPTFNLVSAHYKLRVEENGDAYVGRKLEIDVTSGTALHFLELRADADRDIAAVQSLDDIDFEMQDLGSESVDYLTIEDKSLEKRVLFFFLPRVREEETSPREILIEFNWPNLMWRIAEEGYDDYSFRLDHPADEVRDLRFTIEVSDSLGSPSVNYLGPDIQGLLPSERTMVDGYCQYQYHTENAPLDGTEYLFRVSGSQ